MDKCEISGCRENAVWLVIDAPMVGQMRTCNYDISNALRELKSDVATVVKLKD